MITAQQAREMKDSKPFIDDMNKVFAMIQRRAKDGYDYGWLISERLSDEQQAKLIELGIK